MKKISNWLFGSFFRTIGRVIAFIAIGLFLSYIINFKDLFKKINLDWLIMSVNASTLTSYGNYTENTNTFNTCGNSGTYSYSKSTPNVQGAYYWERGNIGATISGKAYSMSFLFKTGLTAQKTYDVVITMNSNDFTNTLNANSIHLFNGSSCENMYNNDISLLSFTNNATSGTNTNKMKFRIYANSIISWWGFELLGGNKNITSVNNFGVKNITITEVDTSGNNQVIENNNNNTQNIIDNDKQNTQNIIDNVNNQLSNICENMFDSSTIIDNNLYNQSGDIRKSSRQELYLEPGTYSFSTNLSSNYWYEVAVTDIKPGSGIIYNYIYQSGWKSGNLSFTINTGGYFSINLRKTNNTSLSLSDINIYNYMLLKGNTFKTYCEYGTYSSKIDDLNNNINDINNSINDTDISQSTNEAFSFFNNFNTDTHGLTSVITAPLNAIQSLTSKTCSPLVLPIPFLNNKNLSLPCMRNIYDEFFGDFMIIYDVITLGIISYWILVRIFNLVKDFKNPDHDEIEVMDL